MAVRVDGKSVVSFWKYMSKKYDFKVVSKSDAVEMRVVAWAMDMMNVMNVDDFLDKYSTTVCLGWWRVVYVPFEIGKGNQNQLIGQIATCVHESQHVVQATRDPGQPMKYLTSDSNRAFYEADSNRATMEMYYYFTGRVLSPRKLSDGLMHYSVGAADRRVCRKHLIIASKVIGRGGIITGTSKTAIRWWRRKKISSNSKISIMRVYGS